MSAIQNLHSFDPFADASKGDDLLPAGTEDYIHIRIQQRNGRKTLTTVQGIADDYDKKKLVKAFKKKFACNGTVIEHPEYGEVIQLQGDQRKNICQFLIEVSSVLPQHCWPLFLSYRILHFSNLKVELFLDTCGPPIHGGGQCQKG
ncbi:rCG33041, isoform CRA_a, partial [Rattus norvegicus]